MSLLLMRGILLWALLGLTPTLTTRLRLAWSVILRTGHSDMLPVWNGSGVSGGVLLGVQDEG